VHLDSAERRIAPAGHAWLILTGHVAHITGTNSAFYIVKKGEAIYKFMSKFLAASGTGGYPLFSTEPVEDQAQWQPLFVLGDLEIVFTGGTNSGITLTMLEWELE